MNRAFLIIIIPALLVAVGYIVVLRYMGIAPGYPRLILAMVLFFGMIYWLSAGEEQSEFQPVIGCKGRSCRFPKSWLSRKYSSRYRAKAPARACRASSCV